MSDYTAICSEGTQASHVHLYLEKTRIKRVQFHNTESWNEPSDVGHI